MKFIEASAAPSAPMPLHSAPEAPFWQALALGDLQLPRCRACLRRTWPPQPRCGACGGWSFVWETVAPQGTIYAAARTRHRFNDAAGAAAPYAVVLVELPAAGGVRLLGRLLDGPDQAAIGTPVVGVVHPARSPDERPSLCWRVASAA